jgi:hypothetical protein
VSEPAPAEERPKWKTGSLWGILAVFLILGSVGLATIVYGFAGLFVGQPWDLVAVPFGFVMAALSFLFMAGILYRVDRYRGIEGRRVALFE